MEQENQNKSTHAQREERVLSLWKERSIFAKTLEKNAPKGEYVFYEGPPTANAKPALHHLIARVFKDAIPRYRTMQGYHVNRRAGWDTHGLPVELQIEKKLGLTSKKEIEQYGIAQFNKECKESVFTYIKDWEDFTDRIGYWVDKENAYYTFNATYMETLWNILGTAHKRNLLYKDYKVVPYCPRCGTALASHELAQGYQDDKDLSVYAKFKVVGQENTYILAWTTTPWTLPGNVALAVGNDIDYVKVQLQEAEAGSTTPSVVILAKERMDDVLHGPYTVLEEMKGSALVGMQYEPLYPELLTHLQTSKIQKEQFANYVNGWKVYPADFVTTTDGTGVVHTAVMYGQDDFELGTKVGLPKVHTVDETGRFISGVTPEFLQGRFVKDEAVAIDIIKDLAGPGRGLLYMKQKYEHSYPHCWRCKTPLIYYARDSWYIAMSKLRDDMVKENEGINWEPSHIKEGRFGEWLRDIKDWAISRERYWGTPLPVWQSADGELLVVDSVQTLKDHVQKSGNNYFVMRHGQTSYNVDKRISCDVEADIGLTEQGREETKVAAQKLASEKITKVFVSPFLRTRQTAEIVAKELGIPESAIAIDERLGELGIKDFNDKTLPEYFAWREQNGNAFDLKTPNGECLQDAKKRFGEFLYEIESKYQNENILIVTHGIGVEMLTPVAEGYDAKRSLAYWDGSDFPNGFMQQIPFVPLPHNDNYELDLHRPYIDQVVLHKDGKEFHRVKEVMDVWFDSGSMPFAQDHYPFDNKDYIETTGYPADFISEAIDQTRGWFYTLHAVGTIMGRGKAYKNVICLGHILDAEGKKMSKSIGNIVDPWEQMNKYGVDALRLWMYSVNQPGDSKNYDEKTVDEIVKKFFLISENVYKFYEPFKQAGDIDADPYQSEHVLDQWILALLDQLIENTTTAFEHYDLFTAARGLREFVNDLSTWYLRRSRDRFKGEGEDAQSARVTISFVLREFAKLAAPMVPFFAEDLYQKLGGTKESVHLEQWPVAHGFDSDVLNSMKIARDLATTGNAIRKKIAIPLRQPLQSFQVKTLALATEYLELLKDELNVKEVVSNDALTDDAVYDTNITEALKHEGMYRELLRVVQDLRKEKGLSIDDTVKVFISPEPVFLANFKASFENAVQAKEVSYADNDGAEVSLGGEKYKVAVELVQ